MRFKPLPTSPYLLQLLASEAKGWLDNQNPMRAASRELRRLQSVGYPPPDAFGPGDEHRLMAWDVAATIQLSRRAAASEAMQRHAEAERTAPATPTLWDHVEWPFEWDRSEGGDSKDCPPSWLAAFEGWDPQSALFLCDLVDGLLGEVHAALEGSSPAIRPVVASRRQHNRALGVCETHPRYLEDQQSLGELKLEIRQGSPGKRDAYAVTMTDPARHRQLAADIARYKGRTPPGPDV